VRILLTGGAANGKSTFAEDLAVRLGTPRFYVAAMMPYGEESECRIARHRTLRAAKGFVTVERHTDLAGLRLPKRGTVLLECLCNLTANEMFEPEGAHDCAVEAVLHGVEALSRQCENLIVVTNDVGADGGGYDPTVVAYIETLGHINRALAVCFDRVYELCCGIPLSLKGTLL
jgi:Adenosyl cobinamide kinase/adenosyl cobinamide phosphate guanylyltransferase